MRNSIQKLQKINKHKCINFIELGMAIKAQSEPRHTTRWRRAAFWAEPGALPGVRAIKPGKAALCPYKAAIHPLPSSSTAPFLCRSQTGGIFTESFSADLPGLIRNWALLSPPSIPVLPEVANSWMSCSVCRDCSQMTAPQPASPWWWTVHLGAALAWGHRPNMLRYALSQTPAEQPPPFTLFFQKKDDVQELQRATY